MTGASPQRVGASVGYVTELGPVEAGAVLYLRLWNGGSKAKLQVWSHFSTALGHQQGRNALGSLGTLCDLCARYGRRPLIRHEVTCRCLGADESCFANFISYASEGAREDALLIATTIVRPDMAETLVGFAEEFGLVLRRMALRYGRNPDTRRTLH